MARNDDYDDLRGVDLSKLDLDHIELDIDRPPSPIWRWLALAGLIGMGAGVLWFPSSSYYQMLGANNWIFFVICGVAVLVGVFGGRWLLRWAEDSARAYALRRELEGDRPKLPPKPPSALRRWATLLVVIGGIVGILVGLPASGRLEGDSGLGVIWFTAAIGAVVVGIILGRWLLMQGDVAEKIERIPIRLPPWFKWVTLAFMIAAGLAALLVPSLYSGSEMETVRFSLGGLGFFVGIVGAIWLARRFEESEKRIRNEAERRRGKGA